MFKWSIQQSYLVSESESTIEFELFPSMSLFPSCAARVIGPFKSETFQPRLSCLQFGAIDICTILPHSLNIMGKYSSRISLFSLKPEFHEPFVKIFFTTLGKWPPKNLYYFLLSKILIMLRPLQHSEEYLPMLNIQIQILISTYFQHWGLSND